MKGWSEFFDVDGEGRAAKKNDNPPPKTGGRKRKVPDEHRVFSRGSYTFW